MQIHILGGGAIGQLLAFHLTRALRLPSHASHLPAFLPSADRTGTTIHIRNPGIAQKLNEAGGIVTLQHNSATRSQHGIVVHGGLGALPGAPPATLPEGSKTTGSGATLQDKQKWKQILAASSRHQLRTHKLQQRDVLRSGISIFEPQQGSDAHIDTLFLCTKADTASFALESLLPRLSPRSTVVLTQNGLGLADILIAKHFPDPARRPWIILSSLTHGLYRTRQDALHAVHASLGDIQFAVLPDLRCRSLPGGMERRAPWPSSQHSNPSNNNIWPPDTLSLEHIDNYFTSLASRARPAYYNTALPNEDEERPPHEASSLVHTISLLLAAEELKANWIPLPDFHRRALRKLAINACINPLTALLECQNGALSGGPPPSSSSGGDPTVDGRTSEAQRERGRECVGIMKDVCQEISAVVQERAERTWWASRRDTQRNDDTPASWSAHDVLDFTSSSQTDESSTAKIDLQPQSLTTQSVLAPPQDHQSKPPPLHPTLTSEALFTEVQRVLDLVRENYSSMYQDVVLNGRASSEVSFVNGYVRRLGDGLNEEFERAKRSGGRMVEGMKEVRTPINRMLERLIVAKCDLFGSLAVPQSSPSPEGKVTRSRSFPTVASNKVRKQAVEIEVPGREKVGFRKKRAGGFGRGWEERKLLAFFRMKEARELERKGEGAGGRKEVVVQVEEERGEGDGEEWRDEQEELERGNGKSHR